MKRNLQVSDLAGGLTDWKHAVVTPLFKHRGAANNPSNYRPVSLLHAVGKVLDNIQSEVLCTFLTRKNLISNHQFGFLPGRSTTEQLIYMVQTWIQELDSGRSVGAVFMDFRKAFDRVWHDGLLFKLARCGISYYSLQWIKSYLTSRSLSVRVGSSISSSHSISSGVPQGSHLGPILFLVFINDLSISTAPVPTEIYADDSTLFKAFPKSADADLADISTLQTGVDNASSWARSWHGEFSPSKTIALHIGSSSPLYLAMDNQQIAERMVHKHLGVHISKDLKWHHHISVVISMGRQRAGLLRLMAKTFPRYVVSKLYLSYLRPCLEYASPLWHGALTNEEVMTLERLQASVARTILKMPWDTPKQVLLKEMDWPTLRWRRAVASMVQLHSFLYHARSTPMSALLFPFSSSVTKRSLRKPFNLVLGDAKSTRRLSSFLYRNSILWNTLPSAIQSIKNKNTFKRSLELHWQEYRFLNVDIPV